MNRDDLVRYALHAQQDIEFLEKALAASERARDYWVDMCGVYLKHVHRMFSLLQKRDSDVDEV